MGIVEDRMETIILVVFANIHKQKIIIAVGQDRRSKAIVEQLLRIKNKSKKSQAWKENWKKQLTFLRTHYQILVIDNYKVVRTPAYRFGYGGRFKYIEGSCILFIPTIAQIAADRYCNIHHAEDDYYMDDNGNMHFSSIPKHIDMRFPVKCKRLPPYPVVAQKPRKSRNVSVFP